MNVAELNIMLDNRTQTIINGIIQQSKIVTLTCPNCDNILFNLGNQIQNYDMAFKYLEANKNAILNTMKYCPKCGQEFTLPTLVEEAIQEDGSNSSQD